MKSLADGGNKPRPVTLNIFFSVGRLLKVIFPAILILSCGCFDWQEELEAERVAERIHSQLKSQEDQSIYRESGDSFKRDANEARFIAAMRQIHEAFGSLKETRPLAYQSGFDSDVGGKKYVLIFELNFERGRAKETITLTRAKDGKLRLWDLVIDPLL
jgi:Protein of unknown function (DUF4019)